MIELGIALFLHTQPVVLTKPPKVAILAGESNQQIKDREEAEKKEKEALKKIKKTSSGVLGSSYTGGEATILYEDHTNNCVLWAKQQTGINRVLGNGARAGIQGHEPKVGAIGSLSSGVPHAVVVVAVNGDEVVFHESNFYKNKITMRVLPKSQFIGFVYF